MSTTFVSSSPETILIPESNLAKLQEEIAYLNRKAEKLNNRSISLFIHGYKNIEQNENGRKYIIRYAECSVVGERPQLGDWCFVGTLQEGRDDRGNVMNFIRCLPGEQMPVEFRGRAKFCDHCLQNRLRNDTYVVRNLITGEHRQVGSTCIKDFCGHADPKEVLRYAQYLAEAGDLLDDMRGEKGFSQIIRYRVREILAQTAAVIRNYGWLSKKKAYENPDGPPPTADIVFNAICRPQDMSLKLLATSDDYEMADRAIDWVESLRDEADQLNDYQYNIVACVSIGLIEARNFGVACSILGVYSQKVAESLKKKESRYVGSEGDKIAITANLIFYKPCETRYGVSHLYKFVDKEGDLFVWFASNRQSLLNEIGMEVRLAGTIKGHSEFRNEKQTSLIRCKIRV